MGGRKQSKIDWAELRHDIVGGIRSGAYHSAWYVKNWAEQSVVHPTLSRLGFNVAKEKPTFDGLKVVGVGYGRTGTVSSHIIYWMGGARSLYVSEGWSKYIMCCVFCFFQETWRGLFVSRTILASASQPDCSSHISSSPRPHLLHHRSPRISLTTVLAAAGARGIGISHPSHAAFVRES